MERSFGCAAGSFNLDDVMSVGDLPNGDGKYDVRLAYGQRITVSAADRWRLMYSIAEAGREGVKEEMVRLPAFFEGEATRLSPDALRVWLVIFARNWASDSHASEACVRAALPEMSDAAFIEAIEQLFDRGLLARSSYDFDAVVERLLEAIIPTKPVEAMA